MSASVLHSERDLEALCTSAVRMWGDANATAAEAELPVAPPRMSAIRMVDEERRSMRECRSELDAVEEAEATLRVLRDEMTHAIGDCN